MVILIKLEYFSLDEMLELYLLMMRHLAIVELKLSDSELLKYTLLVYFGLRQCDGLHLENIL